jgi:HPt (histidine-containing phosphotransfer) domain-containing protein
MIMWGAGATMGVGGDQPAAFRKAAPDLRRCYHFLVGECQRGQYLGFHSMNLQPRVCDLSGALARMGGDRELLQRMVDFFREDAPEYLARLHAAADQGDRAGVEYAAHSLNGLVANFGAESASLVALRLEEMGRSGDLSSASEAVATLEDEIARLEATLAREAGRV